MQIDKIMDLETAKGMIAQIKKTQWVETSKVKRKLFLKHVHDRDFSYLLWH